MFIAPYFLRATVLPSNSSSLGDDSFSWGDDNLHIVYVMDGGINSLENPTSITPSYSSFYLHTPYKHGCVFQGWYYDSRFTRPAEKVYPLASGTLFLYAKWNSIINNNENVVSYPYNNEENFFGSGGRETCLKYLNYTFLEDLAVPGMPSTRDQDFYSSIIFSTAQCPQGLCFTDDYILITSYSSDEGVKGVLMVFDRYTNEYLVSLAMDEESHLGGICFDGSNIWVCNSEKQTIERISYDFLTLMVTKNRGSVVDASEVVDSYRVENSPSCITYYDSRIWIATHATILNSEMVAYYYDPNSDELTTLGSYNIPPRVQGVSFDDDGRVYLSTSYGRNISSYLKIYDSIIQVSANPADYVLCVEMPPCSEEIDMDDDGNLYVLFESGGEKYYEGTDGRGRAAYPIDQILIISPIFE